MNDAQFLSVLNTITREHRLKLPGLGPGKVMGSEEISAWANYLELCMKQGVQLADPRWKRLAATFGTDYTVFSLEMDSGPPPDEDFRVGLQLLMGMLEQLEENKE